MTRKLFIAIPTYTGKPCKETRRSLRAALPRLGIENRDWQFMALSGMCYLDHARNILVSYFLRSDCSDLLFVDDDVGFDADAMVRIRDTTAPIVGGIYPKKCVPTEWPVSLDPAMKVDREGLVACDMLPTGFMRIGRAALDAMASHVPLYANIEHGELRAWFKTDIRDGRFWGEDVEFCRIWREMGGELRAFLDMNFSHVDKNGKVYAGNWGRAMFDAMKRAA